MKKDNTAHINGYIDAIIDNAFEGKKSFLVKVATIEKYKDAAGEWQNKKTRHTVSILSNDKKFNKAILDAQKDIQKNLENRENEEYKPKVHRISVDGQLVNRTNETASGETYYNNMIVAQPEDVKLDAKLAEGEVCNFAEFKGNIAHIDLKDEFGVIRVGTHYFIPGESTNFKGEVKPYTEATSYAELRVSANLMPKTFEALKNGELEVGDLVSVRGQMHNASFTDSKGVNQNKIVVDARKFDLVAKKGQKKTEAEEKTEKKAEAKKETKKAAPKKATARKKGVTM